MKALIGQRLRVLAAASVLLFYRQLQNDRRRSRVSRLTVSAGNVSVTNGNVTLGTAGNKINITTGTNASAGAAGTCATNTQTCVVATTAVTANSSADSALKIDFNAEFAEEDAEIAE